jgi:hypothetical protein
LTTRRLLRQEVLDLSYPAGHVKIEGGDFTWDTKAPKPTIESINLDAKPGMLTMVSM